MIIGVLIGVGFFTGYLLGFYIHAHKDDEPWI